MGAGAGQRGGMQTMPQMGQMLTGVPTQGGISALAAQGAQMDPRLAAIMQAMQQQGGMPGAGMMPQGGMPTQQTQQGMMDQMRQANPNFGQPQMPAPQMPGMAAPGGVQFTRELQAPVGPGDVLAKRPLPVGAGGKGSGMPSPMVNPPRPMMPKPQTMAPNRRPGFSGFR